MMIYTRTEHQFYSTFQAEGNIVLNDYLLKEEQSYYIFLKFMHFL